MSNRVTSSGGGEQRPAAQHGVRDFLMSMLNATLVLAIILAIAGAVLVHKVHSFTSDLIADVKVGLLQDKDKDIGAITSAFKDGERDLKRIAARLDDITKHPELTLSPAVQKEIASLRAQLKSLNARLAELISNREALTDHAIHTLASALAQTYIDIRRCRVTKPVGNVRRLNASP